MVTTTAPGLSLGRRVGAASRVELEYYCRGCKGHFSSTVPYAALRQATCRCGSSNLLVYSIAGEATAPLRGR